MWRAGAIAGAVLALVPASAGATVRSGSGTDPSGDGPSAARDITAVSASYDDGPGTLTFAVTFAAAPDDVFLSGFVGTRQADGSCAIAAGVGGNTSSGSVAWLYGSASGSDGTRSASGTTVTLSATAAALAGQAWDCALATLSQGSVDYDKVDAFGIVAPPSPTPAPAPAPPTTPQPGPKPQIKAPHLAVDVSGLPRTIKRDRWIRLTVHVANSGTAAARNVELTAAGARGLSVRPRTKTLGVIKAAKRSTATLRVKLTRRARRTTKLSLAATGSGKLVARQTLSLRIGAAPKSTLAGRWFWRTVTRVDYAWENHGIAFVDGTWAYREIPKGGFPACTSAVAGCVHYTYDERTGALTVGGEAGHFDKATGKLTVGTDDYEPLTVPAPGTRLDVSLVHRGFSGFCGLITGCTTWANYLTLRSDGQFALADQTLSSIGGGGVPFTYGWTAPPDEHGTYEIQRGPRIRLLFANGSVSVRTIGIQLGKDGRPDPASTGLLLDDTNFYKDE